MHHSSSNQQNFLICFKKEVYSFQIADFIPYIWANSYFRKFWVDSHWLIVFDAHVVQGLFE